MFRRKEFWGMRPGLVNFFYTSTARLDKSDKSSKTTENLQKKEKRKKKSSKKLYEPALSEEQKMKAKQKMKDLLTDLQEGGTSWASAETTKKISVAQPQKKLKLKKEKVSKPADFPNVVSKAAEAVAETFKDKEQVKADLLNMINDFVVQEPKKTRGGSQFPDRKRLREIYPYHITDDEFEGSSLNWNEDLGIFKKEGEDYTWAKEVKLETWDLLTQAELEWLAARPPSNHFEEHILWTKEGKLWHFPIDNHQGMEDEAQVDFTEHIFLENHLEPWCPKKGPLRHFMELVLVGLSKNPYLTVQDKKEHIYWYRDYFENKKKLLQDLGAVNSSKESENVKSENEKQV